MLFRSRPSGCTAPSTGLAAWAASHDDSDVLVALCDAPYLGTFRETLRRRCLLHGVPLRQENHGFTPHMTLSYQDRTNGKIPQIPRGGREEVKYESFYLVWGQDWQEITFS